MAATARRIALITFALSMLLIIWLFSRQDRQSVVLPSGLLRIGIDPSMPPFAFYVGDEVAGLEIDLGRALAERLGVQEHWVALGFDGLYDALRSDNADIIIATLSPDPLRLNDAHYTIPYYDAGLILTSPRAYSLENMAALSGASLAFAFGSSAHSAADRWLRRIAPFSTQPYELPVYALDAVRLREADAALTTAVDVQLYRRQFPTWQVHTVVVTSQPYVIAVQPRAGALADALNRVLETLKADGTLATLQRRWLY